MVQSTNGMDESFFDEPNKQAKSIARMEQFGPGKKEIDIDFCYTVPNNYRQRFLANSKNKCIIYNYETTVMPPEWKSQYNYVDYHFPSSNFCAEVFYRNGVPLKKIFVVPHGVDKKRFNPDIPPVKLRTKKKMRFLCVSAPHYRKNLDILLNAYCQAFTAKDDVCLVLKTKIWKATDPISSKQNPDGKKGYELCLGQLIKPLVKKYGKNMPEIEIIGGHVKNPASIYNACDVHVSATGSEGWGLPQTESYFCGLYNIVSKYSGHLDFLDDSNSLLVDTKLTTAKPTEQYWISPPSSKAVIGRPNQNHLAELMIKSYKEHPQLLEKFMAGREAFIEKYSWENAAQQIIDVCDKKVEHYKPGTYNWWPK